MRDEFAGHESTACPVCGSENCVSLCANTLINNLQIHCRDLQALLFAYRINDPELSNLLETMLLSVKDWRNRLNSHIAVEVDQESDTMH